LDLSPLSGKRRGKLRLSPEQLLQVIQAQALAEWVLNTTQQFRKPRLPRGSGGRPLTYPNSGILLISVVQTTWRKSYEQIVDWEATNVKYFQCFTILRVCQFVLLTYIAALAVALTAQRYVRPELLRGRSMVLAQI
jgi:hypothetical protein